MTEMTNPWNRRKTRKIKVGSVEVGGDSPVSVQSMTTTRTWDTDATLSQIRELEIVGCDIIRVACPTQKDAKALKQIVEGSAIPVIVDVHFQSNYVFAAIEAGAAGVRVNPGNLQNREIELPKIISAARANCVPLRIGVNAGSLDKEILKKFQNKVTPEALVESALKEANEFEKLGFEDFKISVKHHDPVLTIKTYQLLSQKIDCPLHLGVTEAGPEFQGTVKSATAFASLLSSGIGDTLRVSLSADPVQEVKVGREILMSLGLKQRELEVISCPTCGRKEAEVIELARKVEKAFLGRQELKNKPFRVAVMGCVVNGPGEAREADIGIAGGRNHSELFIKGEVVARVPNETAIDELIRRAEELL